MYNEIIWFHALLAMACLVNAIKCDPDFGGYRVELVQVLFRHGERTPQANEAKLIGNTSKALQEPWGYSQLTNNGKRQEYKLGAMLRQRYNTFLGDLYKPDLVYARSSGYDRTKASLQLVLASLYPPAEQLVWNEDLAWMPIPIHAVPSDLDTLFYLSRCGRYKRYLQQLMNSKEMKRQLLRYEDLFNFLHKIYPNIKFDLEQVFYVNNILTIQKSLNAEMPDWHTRQLHARITAAAKFYLDTLSYTPSLIRLNGGALTRRFVENMDIAGLRGNPRKVYLYSGHEFTLYAVAKAHGITLDKSPAYGSALILEKLRGDDDDELYVRMLYWTGATEELIPLKLDICEDEYCPVEDYVRLVEPSLPSDDEVRCLYRNLKPADLDRLLHTDSFHIST